MIFDGNHEIWLDIISTLTTNHEDDQKRLEILSKLMKISDHKQVVILNFNSC